MNRKKQISIWCVLTAVSLCTALLLSVPIESERVLQPLPGDLGGLSKTEIISLLGKPESQSGTTLSYISSFRVEYDNVIAYLFGHSNGSESDTGFDIDLSDNNRISFWVRGRIL